MNRDDIIRMAREAGMSGLEPSGLLENFERFVALVAAAEREKCAKKCESYIATEIGKEMADAIRAMEE